MRLITALLACAVMAAALAPVQAQQRRDERRYDRERETQRHERRSSTVDRNGLCIRDTGRPMNDLNLSHRCDREEFWARFNDMGDNRN
ncbi:MAG: hypothetical protein AB7O57_09570 [Hyphomicrobiaceae bacterium]